MSGQIRYSSLLSCDC